MTDNPYESPQELHQAAKVDKPKRKFPFVGILLTLVFLGLVIALLLPAQRGAREAARRQQCSANLKQIVLALHNYHQGLGAFPPPYTVDADGNRLHSWRTSILPYVEQYELFNSIDFSKPWDDSANAHARQQSIPLYHCPSSTHGDNETTYLAITGPGSLFTDAGVRDFDDITDEPTETLIVIETTADRAVEWMSPQDMTVDELLAIIEDPDAETNHPGMLMAAFADGTVRVITLDYDTEQIRAMLTIAGGETVEPMD